MPSLCTGAPQRKGPDSIWRRQKYYNRNHRKYKYLTEKKKNLQKTDEFLVVKTDESRYNEARCLVNIYTL